MKLCDWIIPVSCLTGNCFINYMPKCLVLNCCALSWKRPPIN